MKNLANCKPSEFLKQSNKIRKAVAKWLADTDIINIRKRMPEIPDDATESEERELTTKKAMENANAMLDAMLEEYPDETLGILALLCFVEPENVDDHEVTEYLDSFYELVNNPSVIRFFTSLMRLANSNI